MRGIQAAKRLRETNPEIGVVVLSQYASPSYALALGRRARRAYLLKSASRMWSNSPPRSSPSRRAGR